MRNERLFDPWPLVLLPLGGAVLRLVQFAGSGSFWLDEVWLATNVAGRTWGDLLLRPLDLGQVAPPAFLALSKLAAMLVSADDWALRLLPLACGLATLWLGAYLARDVFRAASARAVFLGTLSFSPALVYYSSEFKQYSGDVFVAVALLVLAVRAGPARGGLAALALAGAAAPWLSHAAPIVLVGVGVSLAVDLARDREAGEALRAWTRLAAVGLAWSASIVALAAVSRGALARNEFMASFWSTGFAPLSLKLPAWLVELWLGLTHLAFLRAGPAGTESLPAWYGAPTVLLSLVLIAGLAVIGRESSRLSVMIAGAAAAALVLSAAGLYPLRGRLILFAVPFGMLAAGYAVEWVSRRGPRHAATALAACLVLVPLGVSLVSYPWPHAGMKGALRYLAERRRPGEALVLDAWSVPAVGFYAPREGLADLRPFGQSIPDDADAATFRAIVCRAAVGGRVWILITRLDLHGEALARLEEHGARLDGWVGQGAGISLVDATRACGR